MICSVVVVVFHRLNNIGTIILKNACAIEEEEKS